MKHEKKLTQRTAVRVAEIFSASGVAEIELGRDNRKGKVMGFRENYWQPNANMDIEVPMR